MPSPPKRTSVAVVTDAIHPYHRGGKEIRYSQLLPRLKEPLDVRVYTMHWWPERSTTRTEQGVEYQAICPLFALYNKDRRSMLEAVAFALACLRLIAKRFDVVEADHMPYLQLFTLRLVTKLKRRPLVVTWNEVWGPEYWGRYLGRVSGPIAWWIERAAMSLPDQILAISTGTAERLRSYVGDSVPIRVVHPAVDVDFIRGVEPAAAEEAAELLFVGRLLKHKGVDLLIEAVAALKTDRPLRVLIVGDGPEKLNLEKQVAEIGLGDVVRFRSDVADHTEVFALMKAAQVFVFPSLREGFGIAALEALACGTSVVTTSHPDNQARHLVARSDRGYLTEATVEALAACIEEALANASLGDKPAETWFEGFDWSAVADEYLDALTSSIATGSFRSRAGGRASTNQMVRRNPKKRDDLGTKEPALPPRVTVVLVHSTSANAAELARTLESLAEQSLPVEYEILTTVALDPGQVSLAGLGPVVHVTSAEVGPPDLSGCSGEWVALVAAGDRWPTDRLAKALGVSEGVDVFYSDVILARRGRSTGRRVGELVQVPTPDQLLDGLLDQQCIPRSSVIVRRAAWDGIELTEGAGDAWDLDLWLQLLADGRAFHRLEEVLPVVDYPAAWTQAERLHFLLGSVAAYGAVANRLGPRAERARKRHAEALSELLIFSRYQGMSRRERLSVLALPEIRRSARTAGAQLAVGLLPSAFRHYQPGLVNFRPRTTTLDFLAERPLHDCSFRAGSLCSRTPLVTIAIPCYNHGRYLSAAVNSALGQTHPEVEIVVVDDGSTDETPQVVADFGDAVRSFRQDNAGPAATYNFAASVAKGEYISFLDADDELHPLYVQELLGAFCDRQGDDSLGFVYCQMQLFGREQQMTWYPEFDPVALGYGNYVNSAALLRSGVLLDASFDPTLEGSEDWDFFLTLADHGWTGQLVDLPLLRYRTHNDGRSRNDRMQSRQRQRALLSSMGEKHNGLPRRPILRRGRMFETYVRTGAP